MNIRSIASTLFLLASATIASAQSFSLKGGYTYSNALLSPEPLNIITPKSGFHAGIVVNDLKIADRIAIQPELLYSMQGFKVGGVGNIGLHYLQMPVLAKLSLNDKVSVLVGPQVSYLANARIGVVNDLFSVSYKGIFKDVDISGVAGMELKVGDAVAVGGRYQLGMNNINKDFNLGQNSSFNNFVQLRNQGFQVYLSYGF